MNLFQTIRAVSRSAVLLCVLSAAGRAESRIFPVPEEIRSTRFTATLDGQPAVVARAAMSYHFLNFEIGGAGAELTITAPTDDYWAAGVEVQPWRWNIRPAVHGRSITFHVSGPMKLSVTRPGDHLATAEMIFVFANAPEINAPKAGAPHVHYFGPGVYHENIDLHSGETVYLAPGAVVFGAINIWGVENVTVQGRGTVIYDGPQSPTSDTGWMHKPNWHVIVMDHARNVKISGITCIVRSRTWMIQMLSSHFVTFDNVKTIGGCPGNANQDGMDWLGGGDTVVTDCFFRASDDIFALYGNWLGYTPKELTTPGEDVENIRIERSVLSTSISNVVRVSWPRKVFSSRNFTMRDTDVIHMGIGGCGIPFALMEIWADPDGKGQHNGYHFEDIRMESWYSLLQLRQPNPGIKDITFTNIWAEDQPPLETSTVMGAVSEVSIRHLKYGNRLISSASDVPLAAERGGGMPALLPEGEQPNALFTVQPASIQPGIAATFDASSSHVEQTTAHYEWSFGDGTTATGRVVAHAFPDAQGTLLDGSGRFRVLLKVTDSQGRSDWAAGPVVVAAQLGQPQTVANSKPGLNYRYYEGTWARLQDIVNNKAAAEGVAADFTDTPDKRADDYAVQFDGYVEIPRDGGYSFLAQSRDAAEISIDSQVLAKSPAAAPQVCGSIGNAVQLASGSAALAAGKHHLHVVITKTKGAEAFRLLWSGPGLPLGTIPAGALSH